MQRQSPADADTALQQLLQSKFMAHLDDARSGVCLTATAAAAAPPQDEPATIALAATSEPAPFVRPTAEKPLAKRAHRPRDRDADPIAGQAADARSCGCATEPVAYDSQAELPAALVELERSWCELEHVPDPTRLMAAGVKRLLDQACAALQRDTAAVRAGAQASTIVTGGAWGGATGVPAEPLSALLNFCERQLVRRPTNLRGASARVYDMQAQLRVWLAGLRGGEMSAAMYRETKKVVTMLGITLSIRLHGSPAGPSASQDSTATVASPSGRTRRPPAGQTAESTDGPELPSSAAEYVSLLPSLLGHGCAPATVRRLASDFPDPVAVVQSAADAADAAHGMHDRQVLSQVRDSLLEHAHSTAAGEAGGAAAAELAADAAAAGGWPPRRADLASSRAGASNAADVGDVPVSTAPPAVSLHAARPAASEPWRGGVGTAVAAAAAAAGAPRAGRGGATSRKASKSTVKRYPGDGRRSSPRKHKSRPPTAGVREDERLSRTGGEGGRAEPGAGHSRRAPAGSSHGTARDASGDTSGTCSSLTGSKRRRAAAARPSSTGGNPSSSPARASSEASVIKAPARRAEAAPAARAASRAAAGKARSASAVLRAHAPASPLPLLPTTVLARATPQHPPPRSVGSPMALGSRLEIGASARPLAQETPGAPGARQTTRTAAFDFNAGEAEAAQRPQRALADMGAAAREAARPQSSAPRGTAALLQLMN